MTRLPVRLTLLLACVAAIGLRGLPHLVFEAHITAQIDSAARQFDSAARAAAISVAELRAAQQAYVAVGQGQDFWFARVAALVKDLDDKLAT